MTFPSADAAWPKMDAYLRSIGVRINAPRYEETEGGGHVPGSEHYQHRARDYPVSTCDAPAVAKALEPFAHGPHAVIDELFFSPLRIWYDSGNWYQPAAGAIEYRNHFSHCHAGIARGGVLPTHSGTIPTPQPAPPKPPPVVEEDRIVYVTYSPEDTSKARWLTDDLTRRWIETQIELTFFVNKYGAEKPTPIGILAKVPTVGPTP